MKSLSLQNIRRKRYPDEAKVYKQLCRIVDEWVDIHQKEKLPLPESFASKSFSGKFVIRVGKDLHKALAIKAAHYGEKLHNSGTLTDDHAINSLYKYNFT